MRYVNTNDLLIHNQYGFTLKENTTDAAMEVKGFAEEVLRQGLITIIVSLDVRGVFDAAWWPSIINTLQDYNCPRNLYNLTKNYRSKRTAVITTNTIQVVKEVSNGGPRGSCCGRGLWNIQYNSLLNLEFKKQTKVKAFTDDLLITV